MAGLPVSRLPKPGEAEGERDRFLVDEAEPPRPMGVAEASALAFPAAAALRAEEYDCILPSLSCYAAFAPSMLPPPSHLFQLQPWRRPSDLLRRNETF